MEKTEANIRAIVKSVIDLDAPDAGIDIEPFVQAYLSGNPYVPANKAEEEVMPYVEHHLWIHFERYNPSEKQAWEDNAPRVTVKIGEKEFQTFLDERGVQRFCGNSVIRRLMDSPVLSDSMGALSLNTLSVDFHNGMFSTEDWLDFMTSFGYSVDGLMGWSEFQHLPIENPLWD